MQILMDMTKWNTKIEEISNNVYRLTMIHSLGASIEKTGTDIEGLKKAALVDIVKIEKDIKRKNKNEGQ